MKSPLIGFVVLCIHQLCCVKVSQQRLSWVEQISNTHRLMQGLGHLLLLEASFSFHFAMDVFFVSVLDLFVVALEALSTCHIFKHEMTT
mmetsp:Transcript_39898/g.58622  ORF Transcript_39898/g.58622 Transcript_39898/m.58622 type:complete len:89 (-) Transcript_39898:43-309(-)